MINIKNNMSLSRLLFPKMYARLSAQDEQLSTIFKNLVILNQNSYRPNGVTQQDDRVDAPMACVKMLHDMLVEKALINPIQKITDYGKDKI